MNEQRYGHASAGSAGSPARSAGSPARLPKTREALLIFHRELRHRRDAAPLHSAERAEAMAELGRVEVEVARIERAMDPPRV